MKILNKFLPHLHLLIGIWGLLGAYGIWEDHDLQMTAITSQIQPLKDSIEQNKKKIEDIKDFKKDLETSETRVQEVFKNIEKVQKQLPTEVNDIEVYDHFSKEKKFLNLPSLDYIALPESSQGFYVVKPYELKGSSTFLQYLIFLERMSVGEKLFNIRSLNLELVTNSQKGRFQLVQFSTIVETYKYNPQHRESIENATAQPGAQP